ncbi:hypothetical protein LJY25_05925 [Hymenobacter sp. BT175]|uniref:hypothetical protein n=1 Tax=Hymenobacter translucens TaxID=2886507 RepID=UPI001D0F47DF|nr:hypothetical protein [Hymenobacter translucens]MCC2545975.1 hypothetical protein [Hymenobacter translucens]
MPYLLRLSRQLILALALRLLTAAAFAQQTQPDPSFFPQEVLQPAAVYQAVQQPDGKRIMLGEFARAEGTVAPQLVRYLTNGSLDQGFNANVNQGQNILYTYITHLEPLPNGQLLVFGSGQGTVTVGGISRQSLLRLNADGTGDPGFSPGTGANGSIRYAAIQPDGKILLAGRFTLFGGTAAMRVVRLLPGGAVDPSFSVGTGPDTEPTSLAVLPNGQILVGGGFRTFNGQVQPALVRLQPDGSLDGSFNAQAASGTFVRSLAVQPDGKAVVALSAGFLGNTGMRLVRLQPSGAVDASFNSGFTSSFASSYTTYNFNVLQLQSDGKVLLATGFLPGRPAGKVMRVLPNGAADTSFEMLLNQPVLSLQALPDGQVLTSYYNNDSDVFPATSPSVALLTATGSVETGFVPQLQAVGTVNTVVEQPDGKLIIGGRFSVVNGVPVRNLARLNPDGTVDAAYSTAGALSGGSVECLALQPDGRLVVGGGFTWVGTTQRSAVARLLPSGAPDNSFASGGIAVTRLAVLGDGRMLLVRGSSTLARVLANGQPDPTFQGISNQYISTLLVQPDGRILIGGSYQAGPGATPYLLRRLLSNGAIDPAFAPLLHTGTATFSEVLSMALQADGSILLGGYFDEVGGVTANGLIRVLPSGAPDPSFTSPFNRNTFVYTLAMQPNQRILAGGDLTTSGTGYVTLMRLTSFGAQDPDFNLSVGPDMAPLCLLVQTDGKIVVGGYFNQVGTSDQLGLARLIDANVLHVKAGVSAATLEAWPTPARGVLHLRLDASARPGRVSLLSPIGQLLRTQTAPATRLDVSLDGLAAGVYLLRVDYQDGPVVRRVLVE